MHYVKVVKNNATYLLILFQLQQKIARKIFHTTWIRQPSTAPSQQQPYKVTANDKVERFLRQCSGLDLRFNFSRTTRRPRLKSSRPRPPTTGCLLSVIGPSLLPLPYLELPQRVTSAPFMSVFRCRLEAFFFRRTFRWLETPTKTKTLSTKTRTSKYVLKTQLKCRELQMFQVYGARWRSDRRR